MGFTQVKRDSLITKGSINVVLSLIPIGNGVATIIDARNTRQAVQSYVFFGVGILIDLDAVMSFKKATKP
jgi:hypothetical protein